MTSRYVFTVFQSRSSITHSQMENQLLVFRVRSRVLYGIILILISQLLAITDSKGQGQVTSPEIRYGDSLDQLLVEVKFQSVDPEYLGDGDIWALGYDGYAVGAKLVSKEIEEIDPFLDGFISGEFSTGAGPGNGQIGVLPFFSLVKATYVIPHPSGSGSKWTPEDNNKFALLLEPGQVKSSWGNQWLNPMHLGFLDLRLGQTIPEIFPSEIEISLDYSRNNQGAFIKIEFDDATHKVANWSNPTFVDGQVRLELEFGESLIPSSSDKPVFTKTLGLPDLSKGDYRFVITSKGKELAEKEFEVNKSEPIKAKVDLRPYIDDEGIPWLTGNVKFEDPRYIIEDPGKIELIDDFFDEDLLGFGFLPFPGIEINLKASRADFTIEPAHQSFNLKYQMPELDPRFYTLRFYINGLLNNSSSFEWPSENEKHETQLEIEFFRESNSHFALVTVHSEKSMQIIEWGELQKDSDGGFHVDVQLQKTPPGDHFGPAPELLQKVFKLGELDPGAYSFAVSGNGEIINTAELVVLDSNDFIESPLIFLEAESISDPNTQQYNFSIVYEMPAGVDVESLDDSDIQIVNPAPFPVTLLGFELYDDGTTVEALYQTEFRRGILPDEGQMKFEVFLEDGAITTNDGSIIKGQRVGFIEVNTSDIEPKLLISGQAEADVVDHPSSDVKISLVLKSNKLINVASVDTGILQITRTGEDGKRSPVLVPKLIDVSGKEEFSQLIVATFSSEIPEGGWSSDHNGYWDITLVPEKLLFSDDTANSNLSIGKMLVDIEGNSTTDKLLVEIDHIETKSHYGVDIHLLFPADDRRQVTSWAQPKKSNGQYEIHARSTNRETSDALPLKQSHRYLIIEKESEILDYIELEFETHKETEWRFTKPEEVVIQSIEEWNQWVTSKVGDLEIAFTPPVNFEDRTLIGVFSGEKRSGGYSVRINKIIQRLGEVIVDYIETKPGPEDFVTDALTYPMQWVSISKHTGSFEFRKSILPSKSSEGLENNHLLGESHTTSKVPVIWYLDNVPLAKTHLSAIGKPIDDEHPKVDGFPLWEGVESRLDINVESNQVSIAVISDFTGLGENIQFMNWDEPIIRENRVLLNLNVEKIGDDGKPTPGALPIYTQSFSLKELKPGHYQVIFSINKSKSDGAYFFVKGDHPFHGWFQGILESASSQNEENNKNGVFDPNDADGDGLSDFYEWALDSNPLDKNDHNPVASKIIEQNGSKHFQFDFNIWDDESIVQYIIEGSDDLDEWQVIETECRVINKVLNETGNHRVSMCLEKPIDEISSKFVRIRVINPLDTQKN